MRMKQGVLKRRRWMQIKLSSASMSSQHREEKTNNKLFSFPHCKVCLASSTGSHWQHFPPVFPSLCTKVNGTTVRNTLGCSPGSKTAWESFFSSLTEQGNYFHLGCSEFTWQSVTDCCRADPRVERSSRRGINQKTGWGNAAQRVALLFRKCRNMVLEQETEFLQGENWL